MYGVAGARSRQLVAAWQFDRHVDRAVADRLGGDGLDQPDTYVVVLSAGIGWMRVELISGDAPYAGSMLYVNGRGLFEVTRIDEWSAGGEGMTRVLVMLGALPQRDAPLDP